MFTFLHLEIPYNLAGNKKNCFFAKDLVLKAEFLKKNLAD